MANKENRKIGKDTAEDAKKKLLKAKKKNLKSQKLKNSVKENNTNESVGPNTMPPRHNR